MSKLGSVVVSVVSKEVDRVFSNGGDGASPKRQARMARNVVVVIVKEPPVAQGLGVFEVVSFLDAITNTLFTTQHLQRLSLCLSIYTKCSAESFVTDMDST